MCLIQREDTDLGIGWMNYQEQWFPTQNCFTLHPCPGQDTFGNTQSFPGGSDGRESACNAGDLGSIPGLGRPPYGGHGNPLQYSCLENPPGTEEPGRLQSVELQRVRHDWATGQSTAEWYFGCCKLEMVPDFLHCTGQTPHKVFIKLKMPVVQG